MMSSSHKEATHTRHNDNMAYTLCCRWPLPKAGGSDTPRPAHRSVEGKLYTGLITI
jgi:hypothetical protein